MNKKVKMFSDLRLRKIVIFFYFLFQPLDGIIYGSQSTML